MAYSTTAAGACYEALNVFNSELGIMLNCVYGANSGCTPSECEFLCLYGELLNPLNSFFGSSNVGLADMNRLIAGYASNFSLAPVTSCPGYATCADFCSVASGDSGQLPVAAIAGGVVGGIVALALVSLILFKARKTFRPLEPHVPYAVPVQVAVVATEKSQYDANDVN